MAPTDQQHGADVMHGPPMGGTHDCKEERMALLQSVGSTTLRDVVSCDAGVRRAGCPACIEHQAAASDVLRRESLARAVPIPPLVTAKSQDAISGRRRRVSLERLGESMSKEECDRSRYFCQWCHHARGPALY